MTLTIGLALGLILVGLVMCFLCGSVKGILSTIVYWTGVVLVVVGLILLLFPVLAWVHAQLIAMLGNP